MTEIERLGAGTPAGEVTDLINAAFAAGEEGLWLPGSRRLDAPDEVVAALAAGELAGVRGGDGALSGCVRVLELDERAAELGWLSVARSAVGTGLGRELARYAEARARELGKRALQLRLLVPKRGEHPFKLRLDGWYRRLGYVPVDRVDFALAVPHAAPRLREPCDIVIYEKPLA